MSYMPTHRRATPPIYAGPGSERSDCSAALLLWIAAIVLSIAPCGSFGAVLVEILAVTSDQSYSYTVASETERRQVKVMRGSSSLEVSTGLTLKPGDEIETGARTAVLVRYPEGHEVLVMPVSRVRVGSIFVLFGEILVRARGYFQVETTFLTAGVEGTDYLVRADTNDERVEVLVVKGAVLCRSTSGLWDPVRVEAAEQLIAHSTSYVGGRTRGVPSTPAHYPRASPGAAPQTRSSVIQQEPNNTLVEKLPAAGSDLAHAEATIRSLEAIVRR